VLTEFFIEDGGIILPIALILIGFMAFLFSMLMMMRIEIMRKVRELSGINEDETDGQPSGFSIKALIFSVVNVGVMAAVAYLTTYLFEIGKSYYLSLILPIIFVLWIIALMLPMRRVS